MTSTLSRRIATFSATAVLATSPLLVPSQAQAASALKCNARMSDATPKQYTNTSVIVKAGKPTAKVRTVAHYKTTKTTKRRKSNSSGKASLKYYVSGATPGYKVNVKVTVTKNGRTKRCSTSFKPHK